MDYDSMKVTELRDVARSQGWKGWSRLRKSNLISYIIDNERREATEVTASKAAQRETRQNPNPEPLVQRETCFDGYTKSCISIRSSYNERRCEWCEKWRKRDGLGDFICKHRKGFKEAPSHIRRCYDCESWREKKRYTKRFLV